MFKLLWLLSRLLKGRNYSSSETKPKQKKLKRSFLVFVPMGRPRPLFSFFHLRSVQTKKFKFNKFM